MICKMCGKLNSGTTYCIYCHNRLAPSDRYGYKPETSGSGNQQRIDADVQAEIKDELNADNHQEVSNQKNATTSFANSKEIVQRYYNESALYSFTTGYDTAMKWILFGFVTLVVLLLLFSQVFNWIPSTVIQLIFSGKSDYEIFDIIIVKFITIFLAICLVAKFISEVMTTKVITNMSQWFMQNNIDCRQIINNSHGSDELEANNNLLSMSLLFHEKPEKKKILYFQLVLVAILFALITYFANGALSNIANTIFYYSSQDNSTVNLFVKMFLSSNAIMLYILLIALKLQSYFISKKIMRDASDNLSGTQN